jgi:uncharacterized OsmC-like protein
MEILARIVNQWGEHKVLLSTARREHSLEVAPKPEGFGSSVNDDELWFLALATCYCNDLYREANKRGIEVESVEVRVSGEFGAERGIRCLKERINAYVASEPLGRSLRRWLRPSSFDFHIFTPLLMLFFA